MRAGANEVAVPRPHVFRGRMPARMRMALVAVGVLLAAAPMAANWPQWRGPSGLGVSAESGLPTTWSARENIAWSAALRGLGSSSPIVWGDQVFVTSQVGRLPLSGGSHPPLARDDAALVSREKPIGGRREEPSGPRRSDLPRRRILQPSRRPPPLGIPRRGARSVPQSPRKAQPRDADARHRRRASLRLVRHRSDRGARHARRRRVVEAPRRRVLAVRHQLGTRQLSGALQGSADPAVRSRVGVVPARARRADGQAALEGGPRKGPRLVQHAAGRARPEWRRAPRQFERAHRRLRSSHGRVALVRRCSASDAGSRRRSFTTVSST